eukprot:g74015.t1
MAYLTLSQNTDDQSIRRANFLKLDMRSCGWLLAVSRKSTRKHPLDHAELISTPFRSTGRAREFLTVLIDWHPRYAEHWRVRNQMDFENHTNQLDEGVFARGFYVTVYDCVTKSNVSPAVALLSSKLISLLICPHSKA